MKIVIDLDEVKNVSLTPYSVYRALYMEYWENLQKRHHNPLYGLATACDSTARELYAQKTGRRPNVKYLILTYNDAEACFELFKQFADIWSLNYIQ